MLLAATSSAVGLLAACEQCTDIVLNMCEAQEDCRQLQECTSQSVSDLHAEVAVSTPDSVVQEDEQVSGSALGMEIIGKLVRSSRRART